MNFKKENFYLFILIGFFAILSIYIIKSFILPLFFALVLVYISNPLYKKFLKFFRYHFIAAILMIILFLLLFLIPIGYGIFNLSNSINSIDNEKVQYFFNGINTKLNTNINFFEIYEFNILKIKIITSNLILNIAQLIFQIFIICFSYYYFSKYYNAEMTYLKRISNKKKYFIISHKLEKLIDGIVYGQIFVRFIQAFIATAGFLIFGIEGAIFLGILTFFAAFLPLIGTGLIWFPLALSFIIVGNEVTALQILFLGFIVSTIDNILIPYIVSEKTNMGPVITLISIIGGIEVFGIYGIILGPFIFGLLFVLIEEIFSDLRIQNPEYRKYIWTEKERKQFKDISSEKEREEFINKLEEKYSITKNAMD